MSGSNRSFAHLASYVTITYTHVYKMYIKVFHVSNALIERLQLTSHVLRNHFRMAKSARRRSVEDTEMVNSCCAHNCTARDTKETREAGITFYRIPAKEPKRTLWLNAIGRKNFNPKPHTVICSQHFVGGEYKAAVV